MAMKDLNRELNGLNPLSYLGVNPTTPPQLITETRAPTVNDYIRFPIGTIWLVSTTNEVYFLTNKANNVATWTLISGIPLGVDTGDIVAGTASNVIGVIPGTSADAGYVLTGNGSGVLPSWQNGSAIDIGATEHALQVGSATGGLSSLAIGTTGQLLSAVTDSDPVWTTASFPASVDTGDVLIGTGSDVVGVIPTAGGTASYVLTANGVGVAPTWQPSSSGGGPITINPQTSNYVLQLTDAGVLVTMTVTTTANTVTVPLNSSVAFPIGTELLLQQLGTGKTTIVGEAGVVFKSAGNMTSLYTQYSVAALIKIATNTWTLFGDLS